MDFASWLEHHYLTCSFKEVSGIDCLGCGMQRSFVSLLRGDIYESVLYYPPLLFLIVYFSAISLYSLNILKLKSDTLTRMTYALLTIVLLSYIFKGIFFGLNH